MVGLDVKKGGNKMDWEWNSSFALLAVVVGTAPLWIRGIWKAWRWYHGRGSRETGQALQNRIDQIARGEEGKE